VSLGCNDNNWPALIDKYTATSQSCSYATSTDSSSSDDDSGVGRIGVEARAMAVVYVVLAMILGVPRYYDIAFNTHSVILLFIANKGSYAVESEFLGHNMRENTN
jgi:hypothetical protein